MVNLEIDDMSFGPYGIGRLDGKSVMVPNSAPGDLLEVEILSARKHYSVARIVKILRPGPGRRIPPCPFLPRCGGCDWQQLSYEVQLEQKANLVESAFCRPLRVQVTNAVDLIVPAHAEFGYRSRVRLKVGNQGKLGFYELNSNELVEIDHCLVAAEQLVLEPAKALAKNLGKACQEIDLVRK